ncbi:LytTR family transcriptional regulator DNA-binding domain-containing protein [Marinilongibacter aquaticus]|uniref:LytTR family transcriptional regulator DNA-binding domain-containing protein n=1 Tax=Marinilongibacter aquaticus TaxID=2975157 RepID=UPI0021BD6A36|nr:LytTR family transcriptional regulator DNA-binding domain-containing protein [Marinilongibacter aquaticus]UBM60828.1 LytTR family transcriptional regulator DNA-binding domain-containing protein [Marinilongibacter aquaticus]
MKTQEPIHLGSRKRVLPQEILYLQSDINYTRVLLVSGRMIFSSTTLEIIENRLACTADILRMNRGVVIKWNHVKSWQNSTVELVDKQKFLISRRRKMKLHFEN